MTVPRVPPGCEEGGSLATQSGGLMTPFSQ